MIFYIGKMREILTSDSKTIQSNPRTSVYLDYIKMIEAKEEANKDAPTEEVKNNVNKIYNEVNSGGAFFLTGCIPTGAEYFRVNTSGLGNSAVSAAPALQTPSSSGNSLPLTVTSAQTLDDYPYPCIFCGRKFSTSRGVSAHIRHCKAAISFNAKPRYNVIK